MCLVVFEFLGAGNELLAEAPKAAEVGVALDLVDWAYDLADGIDGVCDHDTARKIGNECVASDG